MSSASPTTPKVDVTADYSGSTIHQESVRLIESLDASPSKTTIDTDTLKRHLSRIVVDNGGKELTLTDAREKLEDLLGISLSDRRTEVRRLLWKLCGEYVEGKLTEATVAAGEKAHLDQTKESPAEIVLDLVDDDGSDEEEENDTAAAVAQQQVQQDTPMSSKKSSRRTTKQTPEKTPSKTKSGTSESAKAEQQDESTTASQARHFQRTKQGEDVRHRHLDVPGALPISFPKQLPKSTTQVLVQLDRGVGDKHTGEKGNEEHVLDLRGDIGSIGRLAVVHAKSTDKTDGGELAASEVRLDLKGRVFHGRMAHLRNTVLMVSVVGNDARVEAPFDTCLLAHYDRNVLDDIHGAVVQGTMDKSERYEGDINVNEGGYDQDDDAAGGGGATASNGKKRTAGKKSKARRPAKKTKKG